MKASRAEFGKRGRREGRARRALDALVSGAIALFVATMVFLLILAYFNHRSALSWSVVWEKSIIADASGNAVSREALIELRAKLESARKELFDSNTITFL